MIRIGVDFGGTKIEAAALDKAGGFLARVRAPNPGGYDDALAVLRDLIAEVEDKAGAAASIGVGAPGSLSPRTGLVRNSNSTWLNGKPFKEDLEWVLGRPIRMANDANCLALSEAVDGAGAGAAVVFAAVLGTGCGGGVALGGAAWDGRNAVAGEWGHTPLPWSGAEERSIPPCWCGRQGCLETFVSGSGLGHDYERHTGKALDGAGVMAALAAGDAEARSAFERYVDRLARALAVLVDILDPEVIVLGGGMSNVDALYARLPQLIEPYVFSDTFDTPIRKAKHGDSSGVRGAAWLWPPQ